MKPALHGSMCALSLVPLLWACDSPSVVSVAPEDAGNPARTVRAELFHSAVPVPVTDGSVPSVGEPPPIRIAIDDSFRIGQSDYSQTTADWDEFTNFETHPEHRTGSSGLDGLRPWIGHSECGSCSPGSAKKQRLTFSDLIPGETYHLTVYPSNVRGTAYYSAVVSRGDATILLGERKDFTDQQGYLAHSDQWVIEFVANSSELSLDLGHGLKSGSHYLYIDYYQFAPERVRFEEVTAQGFSARAKAKDSRNGGDWYKDEVYDPDTQRYAWGQGYVMNNYVYLYRLTRDRYWLDKLVEHGDAVLAQRDHLHGRPDHRGTAGPVWQEQHHRFAWIGFTGALFAPLVEFARLVATNTELTDYVGTALSYLDAFDQAAEYHEGEWQTLGGDQGTYIFPPDLPLSISQTLASQPAAQNMVALMAGALLHAGRAHEALGTSTTASAYLDKVARYASHYRSQLTTMTDDGSDYYVWNYATYAPRREDIGHGNFCVRFVYECARDGIVFNEADLSRFAHTYDRLIGPNYDISFNVVNATVDPGSRQPNNSAYYWHFVSPYREGLATRATGRARHSGFPFFDFVVLPYVTQEQQP